MSTSSSPLSAAAFLSERLDFSSFSNENFEALRKEAGSLCSIDPSLVEDVYPCTTIQADLLRTKELRESMNQLIFEFNKGVSIDTFCQCWDQLVCNTAILRSRIALHPHFGLIQVVVNEKTTWERSHVIQTFRDQEYFLDMASNHLLSRYAIIQTDSGSSYFVWTFHNAIGDEKSLFNALKRAEGFYLRGNDLIVPDFKLLAEDWFKIKRISVDKFWASYFMGPRPTIFPELPPGVQQPCRNSGIEKNYLLMKSALEFNVQAVSYAAWAIVINNYTHVDTAVFGIKSCCRENSKFESKDTIGPLSSVIPFKVMIEAEQTLGEFLQSIQTQIQSMAPYSYNSLDYISNINEDCQNACQFQSLVTIQNQHQGSNANALGRLVSYSDQSESVASALSLKLTFDGRSLNLAAKFDNRVVGNWAVENILDHYTHVINYLTTHPNKTIGELHISPNHIQKIWTLNKDVISNMPKCLHDAISEQVLQRPNAPAISAWDEELSFEELDDLSTRLAYRILERGVSGQVMIPLLFERSAWAIVAMLGVVKAGGAFVPLDPTQPSFRTQEVLKDIDAPLILISEAYFGVYENSYPSLRVGRYNLSKPLDIEQERRLEKISKDSSSPAYVIFTSGSTGKPKGVVLNHEAVCTSLQELGKTYGFDWNTRTLQFSSYSFDASILDIFGTLMFGGCLCISSDFERMNNLSAAITSRNVNTAFLTPSITRLIDTKSVGSLKKLIMIGEVMTHADMERWYSVVQLFNGYGPTECAVTCAIHKFEVGEIDHNKIGKLQKVPCWVVDPENHTRLVPMGAIGELLIEGPTLASGYLNNPEKTSEAFIENPNWLLQGSLDLPGRCGRLYKTGDLVKYNEDGTLSILGRKDTQVKIHGHRIELGEIEFHCWEYLNETYEVAVEVIKPLGSKASQILVVFLRGVTEGNPNPTLSDNLQPFSEPKKLENYLRSRLPDYMIPKAYFALKNMPRTASDKIDRKQLRQLGSAFTLRELMGRYGSVNRF